jgi:hypothetical protein
MTGAQHALLFAHLFPGDGKEAVAVALCGRRNGEDRQTLCIHEVQLIPYDRCQRDPLRITWRTEIIIDLLHKAAKKGFAVLKIHSHPGDYPQFSEVDDQADKELFPSVHGWTDDGLPHASAVMLHAGRVFGRFVTADGQFEDIDRVAVSGDDLLFFDAGDALPETGEEQLRTRQAFGEETPAVLCRLRIAIIGCSGTGSWVAEQLTRLGAGELLLADPDRVERKNLNRIVGSIAEDAAENRFKVEALASRLPAYGTGTFIIPVARSILSREVACQLGDCDVLFGCVDSLEGRDVLNRVATFYNIPYFDVGVQLRADGKGGIETVCGSVHYLLPDGSSLLSRGVYTSKMLADESLRRTDPDEYEQQLREGYIRGVNVDSPAVISVNGFCASMAVNEFLARAHPFRIESNADYRWQQLDIVNSFWQPRRCDEPCRLLAKHTGRGDMEPFLNMSLVEA